MRQTLCLYQLTFLKQFPAYGTLKGEVAMWVSEPRETKVGKQGKVPEEREVQGVRRLMIIRLTLSHIQQSTDQYMHLRIQTS